MAIGCSLAAGQEVIWDYGHDAGRTNGCWANTTAGQNFAERVIWETNQTVTAMRIFTCIAKRDGTVHIKILADNGGVPGAVVAAFDVTPDSWEPDHTGENVVTASFGPVNLDANTPYWIGMSGNGFELGQHALNPGPENNQMAQFSGPNYSFMTGVGDQKFQLLGGGDTCQYTVKKSKAKGGCEACPPKGGNFSSETECEDVGDCAKKVKATIACPGGGPGTCKIKGKRSACG
ncbi:MAG: hypothetical protein C4547_01865 [Phycisphaerales bacterium]|nr:MAG: hypothetical protein C4547_01865 [Phycisphaerales bacterium]